MIIWLYITLVIAFPTILLLLLLLILRRCFRPKTLTTIVVSDAEISHNRNFQNGIPRLHPISSTTKSNNYHVIRKSPIFFSWSDHPSLVADAVENGWSRFAFRTFASSPSAKSDSSEREDESGSAEIGWEICEGLEDYYMQKIRFNPGLRRGVIKTVDSPPMGAVSVMRTCLPLPGPRFGNSCFPQEAYFEITILAGGDVLNDHPERDRLEGEKIKLIEEVKIEEKWDDGNTEIIWLSVGLMGKGPLPMKIPGSFPGSIGFNSNGSVCLNGNKLMVESEKDEWRPEPDKVIGCGYNPVQKTVFFTVDSQLAHEIHCKTEEFGYPLYPTLASSTDIRVLVNLGQIPFKFAPGNIQRTPNPCFIGPGQTISPALAYSNITEDSKELFSMGRIDSQWLQRSVTRNYNTVSSVKSLEFDQESDGDLFEIVLDSTGRSPYSRTC
ncbi:hypothetical protein OROMI_031760 [Orobanche minor]